MKRTPLIGKYDVGMLQTAMRVCLARADLRNLRARVARRDRSPVLGSDFRTNGKLVPL